MNKLREFREQAGMTQSDLATVLDCTRGAICHYETGRRGIDASLCRKLINALKAHGVEVSFDDLFPAKAA